MDEKYIENESLVERVMRQVEQLKLWRLRDDKTGFREDYEAVLKMIDELPESKEKSHALADTLLMGSWWLDDQNNEDTQEKIKKAAFDSHNDEVMLCVMGNESQKIKRGDERIEYMLNTQIPYLRKNNFPKSEAYMWFWMGYEHRLKGEVERAIECYKEMLKILGEDDVYYANALSAIKTESLYLEALKENRSAKPSASATGEQYRYIDGKLYFWSQPGYSVWEIEENALFWNCSQLDGLIYDPSLKVGESVISPNGNGKLTLAEDDAVCETPAGVFKNCKAFVFEDPSCQWISYCKTYFCEGVGLVKQNFNKLQIDYEWLLSDYNINGGEGLVPFCKDNRWSYELKRSDEALICDRINEFSVTAYDNGTATVSATYFLNTKGYTDTWKGRMLEARMGYAVKSEGHGEKLKDAMPSLFRAKELASTAKERLHTEIACDVMSRILNTNAEFNPEYTEKGIWNFFEYLPLRINDGTIGMFLNNREHCFEWKDTQGITTKSEGYKLLYSFFYRFLFDAMDCCWSNEWQDGYEIKERNLNGVITKNFAVNYGDDVETLAGDFKNCCHISFEMTGNHVGYFNGKSEFWFAPEIGIVKFKHYYGENQEVVWSLTEYRGKGKGYFPTDDLLFRHYEPENLGEGWHANVEFTFSTDESGTVIFRNALGTKDR